MFRSSFVGIPGLVVIPPCSYSSICIQNSFLHGVMWSRKDAVAFRISLGLFQPPKMPWHGVPYSYNVTLRVLS